MAIVVQLGGRLDRQVAELLPIRIRGQHGELRLGGPQRHRLAAELDRGRQLGVLERVFLLDQLGRDQTFLARLAQAVDALALVRLVGGSLGLVQRVQLGVREEIGVAGDDGGLVGGFLLPDADRARFLRPLEDVCLEPRLELVRRPHDDRRHRAQIYLAAAFV